VLPDPIDRLFCIPYPIDDSTTKFFCTETDAWKKCMRQWLWGLDPTMINSEQWGTSGTLTGRVVASTVEYLGSTHSVSFGQDQTKGAQEYCYDWAEQEARNAQVRFDKCSMNASDAKNGVCP
jgi:hypothetical protein